MSDIQSIQVCSGLEQNRRHLQRSPCNPDIHNPDRIHHHIWRTLYRSYSVQSQSTGHPIALANTGSSTPIFNAIHNDVSHIRNGLYDPMVLSRLTRIVSAYSKISVHSNSNKSHQLPIQREILIVGYWTINGYAHITRFQIIFQIIYFPKYLYKIYYFNTSKINQYLFLKKFHFLL